MKITVFPVDASIEVIADLLDTETGVRGGAQAMFDKYKIDRFRALQHYAEAHKMYLVPGRLVIYGEDNGQTN